MDEEKNDQKDVGMGGHSESTFGTTACAVVTEEDLKGLGLNLRVSVPAMIQLEKPDTDYVADERIYAYGAPDAAHGVVLGMEDERPDYGEIGFRGTDFPDDQAALKDGENFGAGQYSVGVPILIKAVKVEP